MQVKITRNTVAAKQFVFAGQVHDLPDAEARALIQMGKAEPVTEAMPVEPDAPKRKGRKRGTE